MTAMKPRMGLIGYGYWGINLLRNLVVNQENEVVGVVELNSEARKKCSALYPHIPVFDNIEKFLKEQKPDAVVIATPPNTHCKLAVRCLEAGVHVLVEKPLALSVSECDQILVSAERNGRIVMVDHTFAFHPAVEYLAKETHNGLLGDLLFYDSVRVNLGGFQPITNVLWDLAPHDLSILDLLTGGRVPRKVTGVGIKHFGGDIENLCYVTLHYDNNLIAHLHLNWAAPVKVRQIMIGGSKKMAIYDDNLPSEKVRIYDKGIRLLNATPRDFRINYRVGDMTAPALRNREALGEMISHFVQCVRDNKKPLTDGYSGRRMVQILESISKSMKRDGMPIVVPPLDKLPTEVEAETNKQTA